MGKERQIHLSGGLAETAGQIIDAIYCKRQANDRGEMDNLDRIGFTGSRDGGA